jgi:hypothetical protein
VYLVDRSWLKGELEKNQVLEGLGQVDVIRRLFKAVKRVAKRREFSVPKDEYEVGWISTIDRCAGLIRELDRVMLQDIGRSVDDRRRKRLSRFRCDREYSDKEVSFIPSYDRDYWDKKERKQVVHISLQIAVEPGWEERVRRVRKVWDQECAGSSIYGAGAEVMKRLRTRLDRDPDPE